MGFPCTLDLHLVFFSPLGHPGLRSFAQESLALVFDTSPNRWVRFSLRRGIHTPVVDGFGRPVVSCARSLRAGPSRAHVDRWFRLLFIKSPAYFLGSYLVPRLFYSKCDIIYQANTPLSHTSPALSASACPLPTRAQAYIHSTRLLDPLDIPGMRAALYNQDL